MIEVKESGVKVTGNIQELLLDFYKISSSLITLMVQEEGFEAIEVGDGLVDIIALAVASKESGLDKTVAIDLEELKGQLGVNEE